MWNTTFRKTQHFYVATVNFNVSVYYRVTKFTHVLVKKQLGSRQKQLAKTVVIKAGAYIVSMEEGQPSMDWKLKNNVF